MALPRDSQRSKVYRAEAVLSKHCTPLKELHHIEAFVEKVRSSARVQDHFPHLTEDPVRVKAARGGRSTAFYRGISISQWHRNDWVVLHELAHIQVQRQHGHWKVAGHGREYCAVYLKLVLWFIGREAHDELKASFKEHRVKFTPPRKLSPEARAAAAERLRKYRAGA